MRGFRLCLALLALGLAGCSREGPLPPEAVTPVLDPIAYFAGRTTGQAVLHTIIGADKTVHVESLGTPIAGNGLLLVQRITEGHKPARTRRWSMRPVGRGHYTGALTDAAGPVDVRAKGNRIDIAYATPNGDRYAQTLILHGDGRTLSNRLTVHRWGIKVATLDETIRKAALPPRR